MMSIRITDGYLHYYYLLGMGDEENAERGLPGIVVGGLWMQDQELDGSERVLRSSGVHIVRRRGRSWL